MSSAFCFILNIKKRITNPLNSSQDSVLKITSRDGKCCVVRGPQLNVLQYSLNNLLGINHQSSPPSEYRCKLLSLVEQCDK